jgi:phosphate transport system permease protein
MDDSTLSSGVDPRESRRRRRLRDLREGSVGGVLLFCMVASVLATAGVVFVLGAETPAFFRQVSIGEFLFGTRWTPLLEPRSFGVLPLVAGTLLVLGGAGFVALPLGLGSAIYLSEYASPRKRAVLKPVLEVLAGIPTVVYGYFALTFITPALRFFLPQTEIFNAASASIAVGMMVLPMVVSLCDDALRSVPASLREGAFALGATRMEVATRVVLPGALSGVVASFILAASRAIGETMIVTLAAGASPQLTFNLLESVQTLTAYVVQVSLGDVPHGTIEYQTIFAVGSLLFLMTLGMNQLGQRVLHRFRERYE